MEEYIKYQVEHENEPCSPGPAFSFVKVSLERGGGGEINASSPPALRLLGSFFNVGLCFWGQCMSNKH